MKSLNFSTRFIDLAGEVNMHMPDFVVQKTALALNTRKKSVNGANIMVMGVSYKANVSDVRESPSLDVIHLLLNLGANVRYMDPYVKSLRVADKVIPGNHYSTSLLESMDAVVITTAHDVFNIKEIVKHAPLVIDTRNVTRGLTNSNIVRL
jgi:UDP-N-acetyl-D-glucosamine dehydrogenase